MVPITVAPLGLLAQTMIAGPTAMRMQNVAGSLIHPEKAALSTSVARNMDFAE